jgi:hypothetical protein
MDDTIGEAINCATLPAGQDQLLGSLRDGNHYSAQEGSRWDFKRDWPFSYSDVYFGGIARLICAFANTHGGIIIFGVHDELRTGGHNKVTPNMDRLQHALKQLLSAQPTLLLRRYDTGTATAIDVLLVCPLDTAAMPLRFTRAVGGYKLGIIWVRQGYEVVSAEPRHVPTLYCRSLQHATDSGDDLLTGGLPPSPANIKRFVGRMTTIDQIFKWLKLSDEPRTFLYGKGGSGKTTIAYEIAKVLKSDGSRIKLSARETLDNVSFITAKKQMLNVMSRTTAPFVGLDFTNERELYEAILPLSNWTSEPLKDLTLDDLKVEIKELFDLACSFIVIDDIDTLTTSGLEAGFDFLYGTLWKAKRNSKILYTIRGASSQSLANSIEVPGLEGDDYQEFVNVCATQFNVPIPDVQFISEKLSVISERRPLVIESIMALRRTAGNLRQSSSVI